jgi:hypothetical protein
MNVWHRVAVRMSFLPCIYCIQSFTHTSRLHTCMNALMPHMATANCTISSDNISAYQAKKLSTTSELAVG